MYRIRLASGEEAVYRTVQELAQAVASGMVSQDAEVYHKAANRWLPINTHPDYRAAMSTGTQTAINPAISIPKPPTPGKGTPAVEVPKPPSGKSPALAVGPIPAPTKPTPPKGPAVPPRQSTVKTAGVPTDFDFDLVEPGEPSPVSTRVSAAIPVRPADGDTAKASAIQIVPPPLPPQAEMVDLTAPEPPVLDPPIALPPVSRSRLAWLDRGKVVLIASAAALVFAVGITGLIVVKTRPQRPELADSVPPAVAALPDDSVVRPVDSSLTLAPAPNPAAIVPRARPVPPPESYPAPSRPLPAPATAPRRDTASTPRMAVVPPAAKPRPVTTAKTPSYFQAYADARSEMDQSLAYVNFRRVFAPGRFTSLDSLRATKRMVAAAGNILRVYRGREVMLEQTFRPDDPGGRNSLREPFETSEASRSLLSDVDSLFGLLVSQEGEIAVSEREIRFRSSRSARAYNDIRREIMQTMAVWRDSAEASNRVTMPRLLQALGTTLPPAAR